MQRKIKEDSFPQVSMEMHIASMENVTCWAFRKLCSGATDSYTGMLSLTNLVKRENTWEEMDTFLIEGQRPWVQIVTSKETECVAFLKRLDEEIKNHPEKNNVYGIQLNASCPSPQLINLGQGAALIKRTTKVSNLVKELLKQDKYKVGIKLRLGLNALEVKQRKIFALFKELETIARENPNFTNVTIHLKHAQDRSSTPYDYSLLNELASYELPLVINGGITNAQDFKKLMGTVSPENQKNIRGMMIGRQALRSPDCFSEIASAMEDSQCKKRSPPELKSEFIKLCNQHAPKPIYLATIEGKCAWMKGKQ